MEKKLTPADDIMIPVANISRHSANHIVAGSTGSLTMQRVLPGPFRTQKAEEQSSHVLQFGLALYTIQFPMLM
eukprot:COSAG05_NODE_3039_length_2395_cov_3.455493_2_plen_73_part_00